MWTFREVKRTAGVSTTDLVGRMLLLTKNHFRQGTSEYCIEKEGKIVSITMCHHLSLPISLCILFLLSNISTYIYNTSIDYVRTHAPPIHARHLSIIHVNISCPYFDG